VDYSKVKELPGVGRVNRKRVSDEQKIVADQTWKKMNMTQGEAEGL